MQKKDSLQDPPRLSPCETMSAWRELSADGKRIQGITVLLSLAEGSYNPQPSSGACALRGKGMMN